jgi:chloride channel protein, CIC family
LSVYSNDTLRKALYLMADAGVTRLLVVNPADAQRLVGKIALHDLLRARTRHLEEEQRRERVLPIEYLVPRWLRPGTSR